MENITLNTNLLPLVCPGTYESVISEENLESYFLREKYGDHTWEKIIFKDKEYVKLIVEGVYRVWSKDFIKDALSKIGIKFLKAHSFSSPREYNFSTDCVDLDFSFYKKFDKIKENVIEDIFKSHKCLEYIEENYKSCSGFISFMPDCKKELEYMDSDYCFAAYITLGIIAYSKKRKLSSEILQEVLNKYVIRNSIDLFSFKYAIDESLVDLWYDTEKLNFLIEKIGSDIGFYNWKQPANSYIDFIEPKDCEAKNFILWAEHNEYTAERLEEMANAVK